jgi:hypothetical protein
LWIPFRRPRSACRARRAGVTLIVLDVAFADAPVQTVNVTEFVLAYLKADSRTLSIIQSLPKAGR